MKVHRHINSQEDSENWGNQSMVPLREDCEKHEAISAYLEIRNITRYLENQPVAGKRYR
jgi:hypothetical protein